jgi:hypothetical protein
MANPKPTDQDIETLLCEVFREHPGIDFLENFCLIGEAKEKVETRYSRRVIKKYEVHVAVIAALERMLATGRLQAFNVLGRNWMGHSWMWRYEGVTEL